MATNTEEGWLQPVSGPVYECIAFRDCCRATRAFAGTPELQPASRASAVARVTCEDCRGWGTRGRRTAGKTAWPTTRPPIGAIVLGARDSSGIPGPGNVISLKLLRQPDDSSMRLGEVSMFHSSVTRFNWEDCQSEWRGGKGLKS